MNLPTKTTLLVAFTALFGCGNAHMKEINPNGGIITLYAVNGSVIKQYETDGKPEMHAGGHIFCRDKKTGNVVIVFGTYTFEEASDKPK
jgi:uncharacterized Zn-binding protein involved in type VI secretion